MSGTSWVQHAPCRGDLRFTPSEGAVDILAEPLAIQPLALELLATCAACPYRAGCIDRVLPAKSKFDGICGGRLWTNGLIRAECDGAEPDELEERGTYIAHGTEAGARAHNRRGEAACTLCAQAGRRATARRREKRIKHSNK